MNRETLKKIDRFLTFGDIKPKVDETDCYYITDQAMQKVIDGFSKELLELHRTITMNQLIEVRKRAGQVEPEVKPACEIEGRIKEAEYWRDIIFSPEEQERKQTISLTDVMRSANCYNDLKAFLLEKKNGKRLCDWDDHKHQEIWDKMLELEQRYSEHYA